MPGGAEGKRLTIYPSEIHEFVYCPRLYFFERYLGRERSLRERVRLFLGTLFHFVKAIPDRARGHKVEERIEVEVGGVRLRGRPDAYHVEEDKVTIIERKSSKAPRRGVWLNDSAQAVAYGFMITRLESARSVRIRIEYPTTARESELDSDKVSFILRLLDDIVLVKKYGIVPAAKPSKKKCARCPFRAECDLLEREKPEEIFEPGSWLDGFVDESYV